MWRGGSLRLLLNRRGYFIEMMLLIIIIDFQKIKLPSMISYGNRVESLVKWAKEKFFTSTSNPFTFSNPNFTHYQIQLSLGFSSILNLSLCA